MTFELANDTKHVAPGAHRATALRKPRVELQPHSASPAALEAQAAIYRQGKTPVEDSTGTLRAWDVRPGSPQVAGRHLAEIHSRFGDGGLARTLRGLTHTRGSDFVGDAFRHAPSFVQSRLRAASLGPEPAEATRVVGGRTPELAGPGRPLPETHRARLGALTGDDLGDVRVHDDAHANAAARALGADAFTVGRSIYFAAQEYRPDTSTGSRLLTHEVAHAVQQRGAQAPGVGRLTVSEPSSAHEAEAERFAEAAHGGRAVPQLARLESARVMRQISFTRDNDAFTVNDPTAQENAAGTQFQIAQGVTAAPHFRWAADFTIHGNAGDPFADFQVGPLQVVRAFHFNVWWGTGANRSHLTSRVAVPIRDAIDAAQTWYADALASPAFTADGEVQPTSIDDTPGILNVPFANPVPPRASTRGWFNWGMAFVAYLGAQDTTRPGAAGFRALANVYWNLSVAGNWDTARAAGARVQVTDGGRTNRSGVILGTSTDFPPLFGGAIFNTESNANIVTT